MSVVRELEERTQECERLRRPTLTRYAKDLVWKKHLDQMKGEEQTPIQNLKFTKIQPEKTVIKIYETRNRKEKLMRLFSAANKATAPKK